MKRRFPVLFFCFFLLFFPNKTMAAGEFQTDFKVFYQFDSSGQAHVNQEVSLTNLVSTVFASQYHLSVQRSGLENIQASDAEGPLEIEVQQEENKTEISLTFNQKVVGKGKTLVFNLEYDTKGLAKKTGQIWEINIPRMLDSEKISDYSLALAIPKTFGQPTHFAPNPLQQSSGKNDDRYEFGAEVLKEAGINIVYGQFQIFDFVFQYHLRNTGLSAEKVTIALPPDTAFQQIFYHRLEPEPLNVIADPDGNWLAHYQLAGGEKMNVTASGKAKILPEPRENFPQPAEEILRQNKTASHYWPVDNPLIKEKTQSLKSIKEIYDSVVKTLTYNEDRISENERLGAVEALKNPQKATCMEFTDLFVTLARAAGFPAREINGYAYTDDPEIKPMGLVTDILHAWPEYWDKNLLVWKPVDPTWEKTTGGVDHFFKTDLNHFAFAVHGQDSQKPAPVGTYKLAESQTKDVQVIFGQYAPEPEPDLEVLFETADQIYRESGGRGKLIVRNNGPAAVYQQELILSSQNFALKTPAEFEIECLPPFGQKEIPFQISLSGFDLGQGDLIVNLNGRRYLHPVKIHSFLLEKILPLAAAVVFLTFIVLRVKTKRGVKV